jgi:hypothetical protein
MEYDYDIAQNVIRNVLGEPYSPCQHYSLDEGNLQYLIDRYCKAISGQPAKTEEERIAEIRADFERVYAPDEISKRALERNKDDEYILMSARLAWIWWLECANFYEVMESV